MPEKLKQKIASGLLWRGLERVGTQSIQLVIAIILARLLLPEDFGTIAMVSVFIVLASAFAESGFGSALIQKKDVTRDDYCSVFYFNIACSALFYGVLFLAAPFVAAFYHEPVLTSVLRVISLNLIIQAFGKIQTTVLTRGMLFKLTFKIGLTASLIGGIVGVSMAYTGFGLWSLVVSSLVSAVCETIYLWIAVGWRPQWRFSWPAICSLFSYSSRILGSGLLDIVFNNIYTVIIGKLFNPTAVGYYNRGQNLPSLLVSSLNGTISSVMFPALASCQDDRARVKHMMRRLLKTTTFLVFPALFGLAAVAEPLVRLLLTDKWLPCVAYLQVSCITFAFWPIHVANIQVIKAVGRSDIFLKLEISKRVIVLAAILVTAPFGIMAMVVGQAVTSVACVAVNAWPNRKLIHYTLREQLADSSPPLFAALVMAVPVYCLSLVITNLAGCIFVQVIVGGAIYYSLCRLLRVDSYQFLRLNAKSLLLPGIKARLLGL